MKSKLTPARAAAAAWLLLLLSAAVAAGAPPVRSRKPAARTTAASPAAVSYDRDIKPLLKARCGACHGNGSRLGDFHIDTREAFLTGGTTHPVVVPGNSSKSYLIRLVSGHVPGKIMPAKGPRLKKAEIDLLRAWIDQGLPFGAASAAASWKPQLALKAPPLPAGAAGVENPVDRLLQPYYRKLKIRPAGPVDDRAFARRAYLDLIGLLPSPEELNAFLADKDPGKRAKLVRALLSDNRRYAEHWLTFWNDLLRNDYAGTGYIDGGRTQITEWLYDALLTNKPYDRFVAELVNPTPESAGFVKGIVWRGVVNASQTPEMQAAQHISQVFMGVNLKCASCHNSFINNWKLEDAYGLASVYAEKPLEMVRCDKPLGEVAPVRFIYPQLGSIDGTAPKAQRLEQLAKILTSRSNGRLPRTMVNRLWARLMGRGLVEPTDEMDHRPWYPELLDWLAADLVENGYDLKKTMETIVTSRAYQQPSLALTSERTPEFVFTGPVVKRMSAEQLSDAVSTLTGVWPGPAAQFQIRKGRLVLPQGNRATVGFRSPVMKSGAAEIDVDITGAEVLSLVATDSGDGANSDWVDWAEARLVGPQGEIPLTQLKWRSASTGYGQVRINQSVVEKPLRLGDRTFTSGIGTHANSVITYLLPPGYTRFRAVAGPDTGGVEQGGKTSVQLFVVTGDTSLVQTRAALALSDPLTRAMGRPNREQVVTQRATVATTLQALEMMNGQTLAATLEQGAEKWAGLPNVTPEQLVEKLFQQALCRPPTAAERQASLQMIGSPLQKDGVEDLLWALVMLPEFQLY